MWIGLFRPRGLDGSDEEDKGLGKGRISFFEFLIRAGGQGVEGVEGLGLCAAFALPCLALAWLVSVVSRSLAD